MRNNLLVAFVLYPFIVHAVSAAAGTMLYFLLKLKRRKRYVEISK